MKQKARYTVRLDADLCKKAGAVAEYQGMTLNNYVVSLIRSSVQYHEKVHGNVNAAVLDLPEGAAEE